MKIENNIDNLYVGKSIKYKIFECVPYIKVLIADTVLATTNKRDCSEEVSERVRVTLSPLNIQTAATAETIFFLSTSMKLQKCRKVSRWC